MRKLTIITICLLLTSNLFGQNSEVEKLIFQGVELHDQGKYSEAIAKYSSALEINPKSDLANYEISYSYFAVKDYRNAIKYSEKVIKTKSKFQEEAFMVLGNSYDLTGNHSKAVKTYRTGISKFPNSNLLHYNLALTFYNSNELADAESSVINAINSNPKHASSHLMLAILMEHNGKRIPSLLASSYFLMLEPNTKRSEICYEILQKQITKGVERKDGNNISINLSASSLDDDFATAELMMSMFATKSFTNEDSTKNEYELFAETNKSIFGMLNSLKKGKKNIWWDFYVVKFDDLVKSENVEAFSYYISKSKNDPFVNQWVIDNPQKIEQFENWLISQ